MALHGINMPLAFVGQEKVFYEMYKEMGMTMEDMDKFFVGAAFYAWGRMGNIRAWGGPMSLSYLERQFQLGRRILTRMVEFGMTPALPTFAGMGTPRMLQLFSEGFAVLSRSSGGSGDDLS